MTDRQADRQADGHTYDDSIYCAGIASCGENKDLIHELALPRFFWSFTSKGAPYIRSYVSCRKFGWRSKAKCEYLCQ